MAAVIKRISLAKSADIAEVQRVEEETLIYSIEICKLCQFCMRKTGDNLLEGEMAKYLSCIHVTKVRSWVCSGQVSPLASPATSGSLGVE